MALLLLLLLISNVVHAQVTPDLTILNNFPNPFGNTCSTDGNPNASLEKKARNRLKSRFTIPSSVREMRLDEIVALPPNANGSTPSVNNPNQMIAVSVIGYVRGVYPGGTSGESCNCKATADRLVDTHIDVVLYPNQEENDPSGRGVLVVEVTERSRRLAALGLLDTNIGNNWSRSILKSRLRGHWVKFTGWLFYDDDHHTGSWRVDPKNKKGEGNWRATGWEVHPVVGIEVLPGRPADIPANKPD
jgi:hypothetical protein